MNASTDSTHSTPAAAPPREAGGPLGGAGGGQIAPRAPRPPQRVVGVVAAALSLSALLSLGAPSRRANDSTRMTTNTPAQPAQPLTPQRSPTQHERPLEHSTCPPGTLPDNDACVRLPGADDDDPDSPEAESSSNSHRDRLGRWVIYDEIPRRPDRPADYDAYRYPVPCGTHDTAGDGRPCVVSGFDLDLADDLQRRGRRLRQVGHGAVDLLQPRGTPVRSVALEHQQGDAAVVYVGPLFGTTVVTRHTLREGGRLRDYLLLFGHLDAPAPGLHPGVPVREGDLVGFVGDTGSPDIVHLHLEARRLRDGVDPDKLAPSALVDGNASVVCDPRNVLPLR
jgi:murein DD-endopeptidase MepM/ murein hydrolase activator NlpD